MGVTTSVFVGRDEELANAARAAVVLISGEPGIGKSRLARELVGRAAADGACVVWGRAWEGEGTPAYWPWLEALRALERDERTRGAIGGAVDAELRSLLAGVPLGGGPQATFRLLAAVSDALRTAAVSSRVVVVIDDLHAADAASLELFAFVARAVRRSAGQLQLIGTTRDAAFAGEELRALLAKVARDAMPMPLRRLTRDEVGHWVATAAPSLAPRAEQLFANSDGNPLFVEELMAAWHGAGVDAAATKTFAIDDAIRAHVALLSEAARGVLARASVLGRNLERSTLRALGADTEEIDEAVASGLLVADGEQLRFGHVLVRNELYGELPRATRVELHRKAAVHLAGDPERAMPHVLRASSELGAEAIVTVTLAAMQVAKGRLAFADAAATGTRVLDDVGSELSGVQGGEILVAVGEALIAAGEPDKGRNACLAAARIASDARHPGLLARSALAYASESRIGRHEVSIRLLRQALAVEAELPPRLRVLLRARLATAILPPTPEEGDEPLRLAREALVQARELDDEEAHVATVCSVLSTFPQELSLAERLSLAAEVIPIARRLGQLARVVPVLGWQVASWLEMGQLETARKQAEAARALIQELPPHHAWRAELLTALFAALDGEFDEAMRIARTIAETGHAEAKHQAAIVLMALPYLHGDSDAFRDDYPRCLAALGVIPGSAIFLSIADAHVGNVERVRGALAKARALDLSAVPGAAQLGWPAVILGLRDEAMPFLAPAIAAAARTPLLFGPNALMTLGPPDLLAARIAHLGGDVELAHEHLARARGFVEQLGARGLLKQLEVAAAAIGARSVPESSREVASEPGESVPVALERRGEVWAVRGRGREILVEHRRGLDYLAMLVVAPHCDVHVLDLAGIQEDSDAGVLLDDQAKRAYRERAESLREQLAEAERFSDLGRAEAARVELDALSTELARALGLGNRDRRAGSTVERARINVQRRLRDVIRRVGELDGELGRHLDLSLKTGSFCRYAPTWERSFQGTERP